MQQRTFARPLLALIALILPLYCGAVTVNDVEVPNTYTWEGSDLTLVGAGTRSKWFMDLYVAALYLPDGTNGGENQVGAQAIIEANEPQAMILNITSGMITSERMTDATRTGFENGTGGETEEIQADIDRFLAVFEDAIEEGDVFALVYMPGEGVNVLKNGQYKDTVGDLAFKQALLSIWLSDNPVDEGLKAQLLGHR